MMTRTPTRDLAEKTVNERWVRLGFDALLPPEQRYIALFWLESEVFNGGIDQFFSNTSGDLAPLAIEGLKEVRATRTLRLLEWAIATFPEEYPIDRDARLDFMLSNSEGSSQGQVFDELSDVFLNSLEDEDPEGLALDGLASLYQSCDMWPSDGFCSADKAS